ncbi:hypothetical protein SBADM41S_07175 [Streptomyces badius]
MTATVGRSHICRTSGDTGGWAVQNRAMDLPVMPPVKPMLAKSVPRIPPGMAYEAKWDGFRAIVYRDGDEVEIGSRTGKSLTRRPPGRSSSSTGPGTTGPVWSG